MRVYEEVKSSTMQTHRIVLKIDADSEEEAVKLLSEAIEAGEAQLKAAREKKAELLERIAKAERVKAGIAGEVSDGKKD